MATLRWSHLVAVLLAAWTPTVLAQQPRHGSGATLARERGLLVFKPHRPVGYYQYLPLQPATGLLVVAHGRPIGEEINDIPAYAERFASRWVDFAERERLALLVPIFDEEHFGSVTARMSNLGALSGRPIGADVYVDEIIARTRPAVAQSWDGRSLLYGHLVGARFAASYAVKHPGRVRGLVLTAPGHYPMPNPDVTWPSGMMPVRLPLEWAAGLETPFLNVNPDPAGWTRMATDVPSAVIVGEEDRTVYAPTPGHDGRGRVERANQWVGAMNQVARGRNASGQAVVITIPGPGADLDELTDAAASAFRKMLKPP